jgi:predicted PhzF superfamily epimerase YddE/YHI9
MRLELYQIDAFTSLVFCGSPAAVVPLEDPVTGSIHGGLAPYWAQRLNKTRLSALQASQRGGVRDCRVAAGRGFVAGNAVQYLEGIISL